MGGDYDQLKVKGCVLVCLEVGPSTGTAQHDDATRKGDTESVRVSTRTWGIFFKKLYLSGLVFCSHANRFFIFF